MNIIPAIDIIDGKCVRLSKGDYEQKTVYTSSPLDIAKHFEDLGARRLHVVDLDGAKASHIVNAHVLEAIASQTSLCIDFGGGIKERSDLATAFNSGADMVTIGSIAATAPDQVIAFAEEFGAERFIVGADAFEGRIMIRGWKEDGGLSLQEFIDFYMAHGISNILCTDISRDGMLQGPNIQLYQSIMQRHPDCQLIASGGVSSADDLKRLADAGIPSVVFGKAYYEGHVTDDELIQILQRPLSCSPEGE